MSLGRLWRTVQGLDAEQRIRLVRARARRWMMRRWASRARARAEAAAGRLPLPDPSAPALVAMAETVLALQRAVHGDDAEATAAGRFALLNRGFDFGGADRIDWRGDFHDGGNPLRRMTLGYLGPVVPLLARGRPGDLAAARALVNSLDAGNPWAAPGVLGDVWHPYAASHRLINLLAGLALHVRAGGPRDAEAEGVLLAHAQLCAAIVVANLERDVQYNHLLKNLVALSVYATAADGAAAALAFLGKAVPRALDQCFLEDGGHAERSPMYHLLGLLDARLLAAATPFAEAWRPALEARLPVIEGALAAFGHPDGDIALFNDSWLGEGPAAAELIDIIAPETVRLPETGYVRLGRGGDAVVFDCGLCGPAGNAAHAHADFLSIEASVAGRRFIVDPGVATYTAGTLRDANRSAASHNGPHVASAEPIEFWTSFRVGRRAAAGELTDAGLAGLAPLWCAGWHDGYRRLGIEARRYVGLWPGAALLVCDLWLGGGDGGQASNFLVPASWQLDPDEPTTFVTAAARVRATALVGTLAPPRAGRHWRRFDVAEDAHLVRVAPNGSPRDARAALWCAWSDAATPPAGAALDRLFDALAVAPAEHGS